MAEIKTLATSEITLNKVVGVLTYDEMMAFLQEFYGDRLTKHQVWDLSEASLNQFTKVHLRSFVDYVKCRDVVRSGGKSAIFTNRDFEFGVCRMLQAYATFADVPIEVDVFRSLSEVANWLGAENLPAFD